MMNYNVFETIITSLILIVLGFVICLFLVLNTQKDKKIISSKPIIPELQITGNGTNMDTVYIYKLEE